MKKLMKKFENAMTAVAFAEAGDAETARTILKEASTVEEVAQVQEKKTESFSEKHDRTMEAITFAEAGEHEHAQALMKRGESEKPESKGKLIVVGYEEGFSEKLVNYALGMAERMDYEIVALNVITVSKRLFSFINEKLGDELKTDTERGAEFFRKKASEMNIPFSHSVKFGDTDKIVKEFNKEIKGLSFILTEPERISADAPPEAGIPVYCLAEA